MFFLPVSDFFPSRIPEVKTALDPGSATLLGSVPVPGVWCAAWGSCTEAVDWSPSLAPTSARMQDAAATCCTNIPPSSNNRKPPEKIFCFLSTGTLLYVRYSPEKSRFPGPHHPLPLALVMNMHASKALHTGPFKS